MPVVQIIGLLIHGSVERALVAFEDAMVVSLGVDHQDPLVHTDLGHRVSLTTDEPTEARCHHPNGEAQRRDM